ncbi:MAG: hypothetical protein IPP15_16180 [Saprospiraceae bacterium]|uniref:Uncharacterized protein n=1 Tax=Candidatus Opimibacter skivensis TaxID=2982028 RepID=A0A9D7SX72_9BACT|nr:hypothetical protein [Candidatus Opimibacter skivensis]
MSEFLIAGDVFNIMPASIFLSCGDMPNPVARYEQFHDPIPNFSSVSHTLAWVILETLLFESPVSFDFSISICLCFEILVNSSGVILILPAGEISGTRVILE